MSSIPMTSDGGLASLGLVGCNTEAADENAEQGLRGPTAKARQNPDAVNSILSELPHAGPYRTPDESRRTADESLPSDSAPENLASLRDNAVGSPSPKSQPEAASADDLAVSDDQENQLVSETPPNALESGGRIDSAADDLNPRRASAENDASASGPLVWHRVREVREQQGVSFRSMARRMGVDVRTYKELEDPAVDLSLSQLAAIQKALDVPLADLLVDRQCLSRPVEERAKMVKAMKTAVALRETKSTSRVQRLATMLCEQLADVMPELTDVSGWPQFGARRGQSALGKALSQPIDVSHLGLPND